MGIGASNTYGIITNNKKLCTIRNILSNTLEMSILSKTITTKKSMHKEGVIGNMNIGAREKKLSKVQNTKRGRFSRVEWQVRARFVLRHLDDPITLQTSPLCRLGALEKLAKAKYAESIVPRGRALYELAMECLKEIERELDGHAGVSKLKQFVELTRQGLGVTKASHVLGITPEYTCRSLKRNLIELLTEKLLLKLH
jgi:hypothetical protein